jgi:hypothetical protein
LILQPEDELHLLVDIERARNLVSSHLRMSDINHLEHFDQMLEKAIENADTECVEMLLSVNKLSDMGNSI